MTTTATTPSCFGLSWSASAVECKGGLDPGYINPTTHTNRRDQCRWYSQCASRTAAANIANRPPPVPQQLIPANRLAQPQLQPPVVPVQQGPGQPVRIQPTYQQPQGYQQQTMAPAMPYNSIPMVPVHQAWYGPSHVPMPFQLPGAQMPSYLAVPEPVTQGTSWWIRLLLEAFRAMLKAASHQVSHYVDHRSFTKPHDPQPPVVIMQQPPQQ